jgi:hypothetical protein
VLSGPQERILLGLARPASAWHQHAQANARHAEVVRATRRLTQEDILHLAIGWVKETRGDGPDFLWETAVVFEALKRELQSLDSLVRSHERLARVVPPGAGDAASVPGNAAARGCLTLKALRRDRRRKESGNAVAEVMS